MGKQEITAAWRVSEETFVVACPSSKGGQYLVAITEKSNTLFVAHSCPAVEHGYECWHIQSAISFYKKIFWYRDVPEKVVSMEKLVILSPEWEQIQYKEKLKEWGG